MLSAPPSPDAPLVDRLDLDDLPAGRVLRLHVEIARDGLSQPIALPVMVARGRKPGPVLGLTAAVHGNELNGIPVIRRIFQQIDPENLRGSIVGVLVVNVPGYLAHERVVFGTWDLNHQFPGDPAGNTARLYASRFLERIVSQLDMLIDLHTASVGRVNSLYVRADMTDAPAARMAYLQRPQIILHNPPSDRTLRGAAGGLGVSAITLEIGNPQRFHRDYIKRSLTGVRAVMMDHGMLRKRPVAPGPPPALCERSFWMYTDRGGLLEVLPNITDRVAADDVVARLTNPFGDVLAEYRAPEAGIIIGRSVDPVGPSGARIIHLGVEADAADSALLPDR